MTAHLEPAVVDESEGSDAAVLLRVARTAGDRFMMGPNGPLKNTMSGADMAAGVVRAAVLSLLELGLVVPNTELISGQFSYPVGRKEDW